MEFLIKPHMDTIPSHEEFEVVETIKATGKKRPYKLNGFSKHEPIEINDYQLPFLREDYPSNIELLLTGWGSSEDGEPKSEILKEAMLDLIPIVKCKEIYNKGNVNLSYGDSRKSDLLCASKTVNKKTSGPCTGDIFLSVV